MGMLREIALPFRPTKKKAPWNCPVFSFRSMGLMVWVALETVSACPKVGMKNRQRILPGTSPSSKPLAVSPAPHGSNLGYGHARRVSKRSARDLEQTLYRTGVVPLVAFLPAQVAYGVARLHGDLRYRLERRYREQIDYCLERVLGSDLGAEEHVSVVRDFFRLKSCEPVDAMRLAGQGRALMRLVEIRGKEHIEAALSTGKGAILVTGHFGSTLNCFSLIGALGFPITLIGRWSQKGERNMSPMRRLIYRLVLNRPVTLHYHRQNILTLPPGRHGIMAEAATVLRTNELIGFGIDAGVYPTDRERAIRVEFLNGQATLLPGVVSLAQRTGAPVLVTFMHRLPNFRHQVLEISPPISLEGDTATAFRRCLYVLEAAIRRYPAHWKWGLRHLIWIGRLSEEEARQQYHTIPASNQGMQ
jgi:lauroyl/myristoyl acyltransferase